MFWVLKILQRVSRLRRRLFSNSTPHWFKDALPLVSYINVVDLLPTLFAITLAPQHFYKRLPQYVQSKRTWFKTPIKFFTSSITLIVAALLVLAPDVVKLAGVTDKAIMFWYLAVICLLTPVMIPVVCLVIRIVLAMVPNFSTPPILSANLAIPLSPWTYFRLEPSSFLWSAFYYGIYFYIALQFLELFGFYEVELLGWFYTSSDECLSTLRKLDPGGVVSETMKQDYLSACYKQHSQKGFTPQHFLFLGALGIFALLSYLMLINPYLWLLRASIKIPTKRMHRGDGLEVGDAIAEFLKTASKDAEKGNWSRFTAKIDAIERALASVERKVITQDRRANKFAPRLFDTLQRERHQVYAKVMRTDDLRKMLSSSELTEDARNQLVPLIERIERLTLPSGGLTSVSLKSTVKREA
jgi:hypothetical protein